MIVQIEDIALVKVNVNVIRDTPERCVKFIFLVLQTALMKNKELVG
jgi:hypothetical protein